MTRLCPPLSHADAARLQALLLGETLRKAKAVFSCEGGEVLACFTPDDAGGYFAEEGIRLIPQGGGDLGARMHRCFMGVLGLGRPGAVLVGTDIPDLTPGLLDEALRKLLKHDAVIGPTADGGYYLIGFRTPPPADVFTGIPWSTAGVADETRRRLESRGIRWAEVATLPDIDRAEDLSMLAARSPSPLSPEAARELARILGDYPS